MVLICITVDAARPGVARADVAETRATAGARLSPAEFEGKAAQHLLVAEVHLCEGPLCWVVEGLVVWFMFVFGVGFGPPAEGLDEKVAGLIRRARRGARARRRGRDAATLAAG